jgi:predicted phospho-2-dehydro-3-deoxyheptonate aldolase
MGPIEGLVDMKTTIDKVSRGGATAVVMHKGVVPYGHRSFGRDIGLIVHLSASTSLSPDPNSKVLVTTVEEALKMGADAVSIHVNIGAETEPYMLRDFGQVARECNEWGMPLLVMIYPRGKDIKNGYDVDLIKQCARAGMELGADIVKTSYSGDIDSFREVVKGAIIPVLIAGGPKMDSDRDLLQMVKDSVEAGGMGVSIGRNIFQHRNVTGITEAVADIVLRDAEVDEALKKLE